MPKCFKRFLLFMIFICFICFNSTCSNDNNYSSTSGSIEQPQEIQNSYNDVLKIWPAPCESKYINTSFGKTHIITWGKRNNPPLILFHGLGNCSLIWIFIAKQLAKNFYVIAPDTIGDVGLSAPIKSIRNTNDYAEWFLQLLDTIGLAKVNVAGISWGGGIVLQIALIYPNRINKMVVMSPAWGIKMPRIVALLHHVLPVSLSPSPESVRNLFEWLSVKRLTIADKEMEAILNYHVIGFKYNRFPALVSPTIFTDKELKQINVPILLLIGDSEVLYTDPLVVIDRAKNNIPDITVKIAPKAGHFLIYDRPDIISEEMSVFLIKKKKAIE